LTHQHGGKRLWLMPDADIAAVIYSGSYNAKRGTSISFWSNRTTPKKSRPAHSRPWLVQTEPLAQFGIFRSQLLRQELAESLVFLFELDKIYQLIARRQGIGALGALLLDKLRSTFPMIVGLL